MKKPSLLDPTFRYVPASRTDIKKTFARIRRDQAEAAKKPAANVKQLKKDTKRA